MKRIILITGSLFICALLNAQTKSAFFEGRFNYKYEIINDLGKPMDFPVSHTALVKSRKIKHTIVYSNGEKNTHIIDGDNRTISFYLRGDTVVTTQEDFLIDIRNVFEGNQFTTLTGRTKNTLGFHCKEAVMRLQKDGSFYQIFYSEDMGISYPGFYDKFYEVPGVIVEMLVERPNGLSYKMVIDKVERITIPMAEVSIDANALPFTRSQYSGIPILLPYTDSYERGSALPIPVGVKSSAVNK